MRLRRPNDLASDPQFHFMVGRLIGSTEMMARYIQVHGDENAQNVGKKLDDILQFFYTKDDYSDLKSFQ